MTVHRVRFHARGGQGAVTAAKVIAPALYREGRNVQAVPAFGVERRGAPVHAYVKYTDAVDELIPTRTYVHEPDYVLCLDETLLETEDVTAGLQPGGAVVINTARDPADVEVEVDRVATVDAGRIAQEAVGSTIVNTVALGSFAAVSEDVSIENVVEAIEERFPADIQEPNAEAARQGYEQTAVPWGTAPS